MDLLKLRLTKIKKKKKTDYIHLLSLSSSQIEHLHYYNKFYYSETL